MEGNKLIDAAALSTSGTSSPLRRKSIMVRQPILVSSLSENDDEAERLARRRESIAASPPIAGNTTDKRRSLGLSILGNMSNNQLVERISQCLKLGAENKITLKNAFGLQMIDFMTYMIKKQDSNMSNLQMASMSLDVSTKIYGFRVDGVHMEILKILGALDKQDKNIENTTNNDAEPMDTEETNENNNVERTQERKKKKKVIQQIVATVESLQTNVQTTKPIFPNTTSDLETSDKLFQAMLPNHGGSRFYLHPHNDVLVDTVTRKETLDTGVTHSVPTPKDILAMEICPPMFHFDFQNFDVNEEPQDVEPQDVELENVEPEKTNGNTFQFDLNASLQDTRESYAGINNFDIEDYEDDEEENVHRCVPLPNQVENIVDFQQILGSTVVFKPSEYSIVQQSLNIHWRGPSHWKPTNIRKILGDSKTDKRCRQAPNRKKKEVELCYDLDTREILETKLLPSKAVKINIRTARMEWHEEILTLPKDEHYDFVQARKLYVHVTMFEPPKNTDEMDTTHLSDIVENYDYDNEMNTSNYCPQANVSEYNEIEENNGNLDSAESVVPTQALTGTNLVAIPTLTNKTYISYCVRQKKIDMKQLKKSIWKCLCTDSDKQDMEEDTRRNENLQNLNEINGAKSFNKIYKELPTLLSKNNAEALSFPISFVSLLHLANEKSLEVNSSPDMTDLIIRQN
ncbi:condensin complex subunit 2 [Lasioglossum baleicum]|uniref:condensin complex subunit 2 n=1 Tax=Lasioglossum baleicum TaxID=434251 RepID=UPI003FCEB6FB